MFVRIVGYPPRSGVEASRPALSSQFAAQRQMLFVHTFPDPYSGILVAFVFQHGANKRWRTIRFPAAVSSSSAGRAKGTAPLCCGRAVPPFVNRERGWRFARRRCHSVWVKILRQPVNKCGLLSRALRSEEEMIIMPLRLPVVGGQP